MVSSVLHFILILVEVVFLFNVLILVHELGHFLAARWRGLVVERFAIWFGKPIWKKKINGVEYCLGCIPAGGYVALPQMADMETIEGKGEIPKEKLPAIKPLDKIIVAFAGPLFSFGLAFAFACIVFVVGRPVNESEAQCKIGYVEPGSEAAKAGLKPLDVVLDIDGYPIKKFSGMGNSIAWRTLTSEGDVIHMTVRRGDQIVPLTLKPQYENDKKVGWWQRKPLRQVRFLPADSEIRVESVLPNSPAEKGGLKSGDVIVSLADEPIYTGQAISLFMSRSPNAPVVLTVLRDGKTIPFTLVPEIPEEPAGLRNPMLGIAWASHLKVVHPSPIDQIKDSVYAVVSTIQAWANRNTDVNASHMQGPIGIMNVMAILFRSEEGWRQALWLAVLINVNLAIVNMIPLPVLDGGHILLAIIEWIRRKPIHVKVLEVLQSACAMLIIGFMLYVTFFDVQDLRWNFSNKPIKFAPKSTTTSPQ